MVLAVITIYIHADILLTHMVLAVITIYIHADISLTHMALVVFSRRKSSFKTRSSQAIESEVPIYPRSTASSPTFFAVESEGKWGGGVLGEEGIAGSPHYVLRREGGSVTFD